MAEQLPEYQRQTQIESAPSTPDFGTEYRQYAAASNVLSAVGTQVASQASTKMAQQLGTERGNNPEGSLLPPLTNFDKVYAESYANQSHAVLGLQAQHLMLTASTDLNSADSLTPGLIADTQQKVAKGLEQITSQAPTAVKSKLDAQYGAMLQQQTFNFNNKLISQQKEDARNNTLAMARENSINAVNMASQGNVEGAMQVADATKAMTKSAVAMRQMTQDQANVTNDTVRQSALTGKYQFIAEQYKKNGKLNEFLSTFEKTKFDDLNPTDKAIVAQAIIGKVSSDEAFDSRLQKTQVADFQYKYASGVKITGDMIQQLKQDLPQTQFENTMIGYRKYMAKAAKNTDSVASVIADWGNFDRFSDHSNKVKLQGLNQGSAMMMKNSGISEPEANMRLAATAAGPIPGYLRKLETKLDSGQPDQMREAVEAMDYIGGSNHPQNLLGMSDKAKAMAHTFLANADQGDEVAAQRAREVGMPKNQAQADANEVAWKNNYQNKKKAGQTMSSFALQVADVDPKTLVNVPYLSSFIQDKYETYFKLVNGDDKTAISMLKQDLEVSFGNETVNGMKQYVYMPIKKVANLPDDSDGFVHDDMSSQLNDQFARGKELYDKGATNSYWEVRPQVSMKDYVTAVTKIDELSKKSRLVTGVSDELKKYRSVVEQFHDSKPPKVILHHRDGSISEYDTVTQASPLLSYSTKDDTRKISGYYDVNIKVGDSVSTISNMDSDAGPVRYTPDRNRIMDGYSHIKNNYFQYTNEGYVHHYPKFVADNYRAQKKQDDIDSGKNSVMGDFARYIGKTVSKADTKLLGGMGHDYVNFVKNNIRKQ